MTAAVADYVLRKPEPEPEPRPTCPLCRSEDGELWAETWDTEFHTNDDRFRYFRCASCDVLFIHPLPIDRLSEIYPANYNSFSAKSNVAIRVKNWLDERFLRRLVAAVPGERLSAIDVGGGYGFQLDALRRIEPRIQTTCVIDIDRSAEHEARRKGHQYFNCRIEDFDAALQGDIILLLNLIEHVEDPLETLRSARAMLSRDGIIVLKTPNFDSLDARLFRHRDWSGYHCPRHWVLFKQESFARLADMAGLRLKSFSYTQGAPFWAQSTLGVMAARGLVKITPERPANNHWLFSPLSALFAAFDYVRSPFSKTSQMFFILEHKR